MKYLPHFGRFAVLSCIVVVLLLATVFSVAGRFYAIATTALFIGLILATHLPQTWHLAKQSAALAAREEQS